MIHMQSRGYTEDTRTEQSIHRQRIHIQSRGYTYTAEDTHTERRHKYIAEYTQYTLHIQRRAEDGTEQRQTQSRGRNTEQRQAQALTPKEKQTVHIQNIFKAL